MGLIFISGVGECDVGPLRMYKSELGFLRHCHKSNITKRNISKTILFNFLFFYCLLFRRNFPIQLRISYLKKHSGIFPIYFIVPICNNVMTIKTKTINSGIPAQSKK